ncbi:bifunctional DNA-formamidopyrimidine glycosylase/DNA-(apurinic or apyrimidinic site) lyase [Sandaracinobacteroides saxicola]|uniref:Formamidopyrimidine-DNA glycosylase n=1 Tax=Sandaracinobacteroides saxicola TaxID=2759707 RepID=A0A7G5IHS9_9SPHN|nr:bifunctional DNA-formamidopyrimidine glycosylase/DNA-(apurinic or apyrimidinic site) lyase [Sandaracinobacteroides saxicola]QMW22921.1 bifunctional DNA-formamidopyrimidine glycosylase/DNA-(apurinic or apyrimidinic site) lyase [Sandaracinobacteroides saxicola]
MPELPEVETVVRGLAPHLLGRRLTSVIAHRPDLRWPLPADLGQRLTGATVTTLSRRAKYGLIGTDRGDTLIFHLGMSGSMRVNPAADPHNHIIFATEGGSIAFHDPRRFGSLHLVATADAPAHPLLAGLGPEPLSDAFTADHLIARARDRQTPMKAFLLDQKTVAGLGNIYVAEALFAAGIAPARRAGHVAPTRLARLVPAIQQVLAAAIDAGGSSLRDHARVSGELGYFQHSFRVYGREGEPCPACATPIRRAVQSARSSFHCPRCQR